MYTYSVISIGVTLVLRIEWPALRPFTEITHVLFLLSVVILMSGGSTDIKSGCCMSNVTTTILLVSGKDFLQNKIYDVLS